MSAQSQTLRVTSSAELAAALNTATGNTTILLAEGDYQALTYWGTHKDWSSTSVTIRSENTDKPAVFTDQILIRGVDNLTVTDLSFDAAGLAASRGSAWIHLQNGKNVTVERLSMKGEFADAGEGRPVDDPTATVDNHIEGFALGTGLMISNVDNFTLRDSSFTELRTAMFLRNSTNLTVENVHIHDVREGINFTEVTGLKISDSRFENFRGWVDLTDPNYDPLRHDHVDMIQYWGVGNTSGVHDVTITGNTFIQPAGSATQTIFGHMGGQNATATASNFTVTNNLIVNGHANALRLQDVKGGLIAGNVILPNSDSVPDSWTPRVLLFGSSDFTVTDNVWLDRWRSTTLSELDSDLAARNITVKNLTQVSTDPNASNYYGNLTPDQWLQQVAIATGSTGGSTSGGSTSGGSSGNTIIGSATATGDQVLNGSSADDFILGGTGDDQILMRLGTDVATGNGGADAFIIDWRYVTDGDAHTITDLDFAEGDTLDLRYFSSNRILIDTLSDLVDLTTRSGVTVSQTSGAHVLTFDNGSMALTLNLNGIDPNSAVDTGDTGGSTVDTGGSTSGGSTSGGTTSGGTTGGSTGSTNVIGSPTSTVNQTLNGGNADDTLLGGAGNDQLLMRLGTDVATGNGGADAFIIDWRYVTDGDAHTVMDLDFAEGDTLDLRYFGGNRTVVDAMSDLTDLIARSDVTATQAGSNTTLHLDQNGIGLSLTLNGIATGETSGDTSGGTTGGSTGSTNVIGAPTSTVNQTLNGSNADDTLLGGAGNDQLLMRLGTDVATGNGGADAFIIDWRYVTDGDAHTVMDLDFAEGDTLDLRYFGGNRTVVDSMSDLTDLIARSDVTATQAGSNTTLHLDQNGIGLSLTLNGLATGATSGGTSGGSTGGSTGSTGGSSPTDPVVGDSAATHDQNLLSDKGNQLVQGGFGDDTLLIRLGQDTATGNDGADTFIFDWRYILPGDAHTVTDLDFAEGDTLELRFFGASNRTLIRSGTDLATFAAQSGVTAVDSDDRYVLTLDDGSTQFDLTLLGDFF